MPPKKKIKPKQIAVERTEMVPCKELHYYYKNPNKNANVSKIAKSLHVNGMYRPIVVNVGTHTGRPMEVLAGNHTLKAARKPEYWKEGDNTYDKPAWDEILCSFVDVDEAQAAQIVVMDNNAAKDGVIDDEVVYALFQDLPEIDLSGTGVTSKELEDMAEKFAIKEEDLPEPDYSGLDSVTEDDDVAAPPRFDDTDLGDEAEAEDDAPSVKDRAATKEQDEDDPEGAGIEITKADEEIKGAYDLKNGAYYDTVGYWQIPKMRGGKHLMQPDQLPDTLTTWAGSATKYDDDPDTWWLYNYGVDSTSGMKDVSKVIVSFYTFDEYFEPWWYSPAAYVSKLLNSGIKYIVSPDFTDDTNAGRAFCLHQLYRNRWLTRYFQEAGLIVLPNISWPDQDIDFLKKHTLPTLPKDIPMISMQVQTFSKNLEDEHKDKIAAEFQLVMDTIKPEKVILYAGQPGYDFFTERVNTDADIKFLLNRQAKLSASRKGRKKKDTL